MPVHNAYKFRIHPTKEQDVLMAKTIGCSHFVFNRFLEKWNKTFEATVTQAKISSRKHSAC